MASCDLKLGRYGFIQGSQKTAWLITLQVSIPAQKATRSSINIQVLLLETLPLLPLKDQPMVIWLHLYN